RASRAWSPSPSTPRDPPTESVTRRACSWGFLRSAVDAPAQAGHGAMAQDANVARGGSEPLGDLLGRPPLVKGKLGHQPRTGIERPQAPGKRPEVGRHP